MYTSELQLLPGPICTEGLASNQYYDITRWRQSTTQLLKLHKKSYLNHQSSALNVLMIGKEVLFSSNNSHFRATFSELSRYDLVGYVHDLIGQQYRSSHFISNIVLSESSTLWGKMTSLASNKKCMYHRWFRLGSQAYNGSCIQLRGKQTCEKKDIFAH